jgi:hypothetical protein
MLQLFGEFAGKPAGVVVEFIHATRIVYSARWLLRKRMPAHLVGL